MPSGSREGSVGREPPGNPDVLRAHTRVSHRANRSTGRGREEGAAFGWINWSSLPIALEAPASPLVPVLGVNKPAPALLLPSQPHAPSVLQSPAFTPKMPQVMHSSALFPLFRFVLDFFLVRNILMLSRAFANTSFLLSAPARDISLGTATGHAGDMGSEGRRRRG